VTGEKKPTDRETSAFGITTNVTGAQPTLWGTTNVTGAQPTMVRPIGS
jgi:hypothetical protein